MKEETKMFCKCQLVCLRNFKTDFPDVYKMAMLVIIKELRNEFGKCVWGKLMVVGTSKGELTGTNTYSMTWVGIHGGKFNCIALSLRSIS